MGYGMAQSLLKAGHVTYGYDISTDQVDRLRAEGGQSDSLQTCVGTLDALVVVVLNATQAEDVLFGENGVVPTMKPGSVVLCSATVAPEFARQMEARCTEHDVLYLDAPISGGAAKSALGQLTIMAAGTPDAFAAAAPVLDAISEKVFRLGDTAGPGSAMKAVNQLLAGVHIASMAEALTFGMTQGVAPDQFLEVISKCAGTSWMLENRAPHIVAGDYTPLSSVNIWPKDLGIVLDIANQAGFDAPLTKAALAQFSKATETGLGGEDDAAVAKIYAAQVGLDLPEPQ